MPFYLEPIYFLQKYEVKILKLIWLFLPAAFANMAPVLAKFFWPRWDCAIDFGWNWQNKPLFGPHKTFRGFFAAIIVGFAVFRIQQVIYATVPWMRWLGWIDYNTVSPWFGGWLGFCAIGADLIKSFFKRRLQIPAGHAWVPFDEIDWIIGALAGMSVIFIPSYKLIVATLVIFTILDFLTNWIAAKVGLKEKAV